MTFERLGAEEDMDCSSVYFEILLEVMIEYRSENSFKAAKPYIDRFALRATPHEDVAAWRAPHITMFNGILRNAHPYCF